MIQTFNYIVSIKKLFFKLKKKNISYYNNLKKLVIELEKSLLTKYLLTYYSNLSMITS